MASTNDMFFAAVIVYLYSEETLVKIENLSRDLVFEFDLPEDEMQQLRAQFDEESDELILKPKPFSRAHQTLKRRLREMQQQGQIVWQSVRSIGRVESGRDDAWFEKAREAAEQRQREREIKEYRAERDKREARRKR